MLTYVVVYMENIAKCNNTYIGLGYDPILPTHLCAGVHHEYKGPCHGDSGGPLVVPSSDNYATIIGISSESFCTQGGNRILSDKYTKVWMFHSWIEENMGQVAEAISYYN